MAEPKAYEPEKLTAGVTWKWKKTSQTGCQSSSMTPLKSMRSSLAKRMFAGLLGTKKTGGYWLVP